MRWAALRKKSGDRAEYFLITYIILAGEAIRLVLFNISVGANFRGDSIISIAVSKLSIRANGRITLLIRAAA
jgi:hypothetical protein